MKMNCPNCNKNMHINQKMIESGEASCKYCRYSFKLKKEHLKSSTPPPQMAPPAQIMPEDSAKIKTDFSQTQPTTLKIVKLPDHVKKQGFQVLINGDEIQLYLGWFDWTNIIVLILALLVGLHALIVSFEYLTTGGFPTSEMLALTLIEWGFFGIISYLALAGIFNHSVIYASTRELKIIHGPFPWLGNQLYPSSEVDKVYSRKVEKVVHSDSASDLQIRTQYQLCLSNKQGKERILIKHIKSVHLALYMAREIKLFLKPQ
jgi:hypothetical protein